MPSPAKSIKFDINSYFQQLKEQKIPLQETFVIKEDTSAKTKTTEDQSQTGGVSMKFS